MVQIDAVKLSWALVLSVDQIPETFPKLQLDSVFDYALPVW